MMQISLHQLTYIKLPVREILQNPLSFSREQVSLVNQCYDFWKKSGLTSWPKTL